MSEWKKNRLQFDIDVVERGETWLSEHPDEPESVRAGLHSLLRDVREGRRSYLHSDIDRIVASLRENLVR